MGAQMTNFNPPAPCGAGPLNSNFATYPLEFQSTRPVRGGTAGSIQLVHQLHISIHPPRAGRDARGHCRPGGLHPFQSTRPVRGGTLLHEQCCYSKIISIHPPRAGRDGQRQRLLSSGSDFNPPAPCGAGP